MPSEIKLSVIRARNLPIMDKKRQTTDGYCLVKFGRLWVGGKKKIKASEAKVDNSNVNNKNENAYRTKVIRGSINPQWD
jgi:hypothetical protein